MWGYANYRNREIGKSLVNNLKSKKIMKKFNMDNKNKKGKDQDFLKEHVWPIAYTNALIHDSFFCNIYGGIPFPTERPKNHCFVSCSYCCDDKFNQKWDFGECPKKCRPFRYQNWTFC